MSVESKTCGKCADTKPIGAFNRLASSPDGHANWCKECMNAYKREQYKGRSEKAREATRKWKAAHPEHREQRKRTARIHNWRNGIRRHGITLDEYAWLVESQQGLCAICSEPEERLHIDHDHDCCPGAESCRNCVRGLLCRMCNWFEAKKVGEQAWAEYVARPRPFVNKEPGAAA